MSTISGTNLSSAISSYSNQIKKSAEQISSGKSINSASDNAATLAISERMTSQIKGTNQAISNSQNAISLAQTAEGALSSTQDALQRMRELAIQASSSTLSNSDRSALNNQFNQLKEEISQTSKTTSFNNQQLLDGNLNSTVATDSNGKNGTTISISDMSSKGLNIDSLKLDNVDDATKSIDAIDKAIGAVSDTRAELGATTNALESSISNLTTSSINLEASQSNMSDSDIAKAVMEMTKNKILQDASTAIEVHKKQDAYSVMSLLK